MKKFMWLIVFASLVTVAAFTQISRGATVWVSAKSATLKSSTWFFASNRGTVDYGHQLTVLQVSGSWAEVQSSVNSGLSGWISTSSLSTKRISATGGSSSASASEVALAGKGFNEEVENAYKAEGNLNYEAVDWTEKLVIPGDDLYNFITEGNLSAGENQ